MKTENKYQHLVHPLDPIYNIHSKILILGSFPSVKSREVNFFYGNPQNRFWKVLSSVFKSEVPHTIAEKRAFLYKSKIALWDTIHSCDIAGSSDSSIKNVIPSDINRILNTADIKGLFTNGAASYQLYMKYCFASTNRKPVKLPSTSPANATFSLEKLTSIWTEEIEKYL